MRRFKLLATAIAWTVTTVSDGHAQTPDLSQAFADGAVSGRIVQLVAILSVLSIAPSLLVMTTSFTRFIVALSFLRSGLGLQNTPGNMVLVSLALFLTLFVMSPTLERSWKKACNLSSSARSTNERRPSELSAHFVIS